MLCPNQSQNATWRNMSVVYTPCEQRGYKVKLCREATQPVDIVPQKVTRKTMPGVNTLCYHYCKGIRVHWWNDVPLIDAPRATSPRSIWSTMGLHRHGPAQYLYITLMMCHRSYVRPVRTISQYCQNLLLIPSEKWTAQTTNLQCSYFRRICACIRWYTQTVLCNQLLIQTDSLAQPRKLLYFKVFAMYSQCRVFLHLNYIHKISLDKVQYNQQNITRTENYGESSSA